MTKLTLEHKVVKVIYFLGLALAFIQFIFNRSVWWDEAMLARNIIHKNGFELLKPLDFDQVAPVLFLQLEKLFSLFSPHSEYGLRFLPLLCFLMSLYLFYQILKIHFQNFYSIIFALSLFVFNSTLLYFSSEIKQYMGDVFVLTLMYYILLKEYTKEERRYFMLTILGALSIWFSNVAPIILSTCGLYLLFDLWVHKKSHLRYILCVYLVWGITFLIYYYCFINDHPTRGMMKVYWQNANGFMPSSIFSVDTYHFLLEKSELLFGALIPFSAIGRYAFMFLFFSGLFVLVFKRNYKALLLFLTPLVLHLALSAFKLYPFDLRLLLYTLPVIIIGISFGFNYVMELSLKFIQIKYLKPLALVLPLVFLFMLYRSGFPIKNEELKESLSYIKKKLKEGDQVYVTYDASAAYQYYQEIEYVDISAPVLLDQKVQSNNEDYISQLKQLKGKNWLLFSHMNATTEAYILTKLDSLGYSKTDAFITRGSSTYLYNFGN